MTINASNTHQKTEFLIDAKITVIRLSGSLLTLKTYICRCFFGVWCLRFGVKENFIQKRNYGDNKEI